VTSVIWKGIEPMTQPKETEDEELLLMIAQECGGAEIERDDWPIVDRLVEKGLAQWVSGPRGPNNAFLRFEAKEGQ
jgi:hypothetical protein